MQPRTILAGPEGYRRFIAEKKRAFEDQVDLEMGVKAPR